jgi:hypothetical protein
MTVNIVASAVRRFPAGAVQDDRNGFLPGQKRQASK